MTLVAALGPGSAFAGADFSLPANSPGHSVTVPLEYQETTDSITSLSAFVAPQAAAFKKEPAPVTGKIIRGHLNLGDQATASNAIPFLWQLEARKLFLDLNRNQDLTDDPDGALSAPAGRSYRDQIFTNAHLQLDTPFGKHPARADINLWSYESRQPYCRIELRSFWQGKTTLQGQDWQVGIIPIVRNETDPGKGCHLLLRPWDKRQLPLNAKAGSFDTFPFKEKIFFGVRAYRLDLPPRGQNGEIKPALQFTEQSVALGELKITGKYIQRLTLPGGPYLVILDQPADMVKIPVGSYNQPSVLLEQGAAKAHCTVSPWQSPRQFSVNDKTPAVLNAGGPLTNSVTATRRGRNLALDYRLLGAGGAEYQLANQDRSRPPEFAIYKGDQKVASGTFAYG
jgi:hypothetical protein